MQNESLGMQLKNITESQTLNLLNGFDK